MQNQHLAVLARHLRLHEYLLYAHGSDLCHDLELRHAMANCFEALMGALFLDAGIEVADKVCERWGWGGEGGVGAGVMERGMRSWIMEERANAGYIKEL